MSDFFDALGSLIFVAIIVIIGVFYTLNAKIDKQSDRTDRLYEMFIDLLKEKK